MYRERGSIRMILTVKAAHATAYAPAPVFPVVFALASVRKILAVPRIGTCDRHVAPPDDGESHAMRVHLVRHETRRWRDVPGSGASHPTRVRVRCSPCSEACETRRCCLSLERPSGLQKEACLADVDILEPSDRRRIWSAQEKAALLAEIDAEGGKVRLVARRLTEIAEKLWDRCGLRVSGVGGRCGRSGCGPAIPMTAVLFHRSSQGCCVRYLNIRNHGCDETVERMNCGHISRAMICRPARGRDHGTAHVRPA